MNVVLVAAQTDPLYIRRGSNQLWQEEQPRIEMITGDAASSILLQSNGEESMLTC